VEHFYVKFVDLAALVFYSRSAVSTILALLFLIKPFYALYFVLSQSK